MNVLNGTPHVPRAHPRAPRYTAARQAIDPLVGLMVGLMGALVAMAGVALQDPSSRCSTRATAWLSSMLCGCRWRAVKPWRGRW